MSIGPVDQFGGHLMTPLDWRKSSFSADTASCVEVARHGDIVLVRDSKDPDGPVLQFTPDEWHAFLAGCRNGQFGE